MKLRFEVRDEYNEIVRCFASKQEAQAHCKLDPSFYLKVNQQVSQTRLKRLGKG